MTDQRIRRNVPCAQLPFRKPLPPFESLRAFDAIARLGGVRKAAQYLCRDHAVLSRHLRTIEDWTGVKLLERTAAGTALTELGIRYHRHIASAIDEIAAATFDLMRRADSHRLHIRCMPGFALHWLSPRLGEFERANSGLDIEVRPTDRTSNFLADDADTDMDIRFLPPYDGQIELPHELQSVDMTRAAIVAVASPKYLARTAPIRAPGTFWPPTST